MRDRSKWAFRVAIALVTGAGAFLVLRVPSGGISTTPSNPDKTALTSTRDEARAFPRSDLSKNAPPSTPPQTVRHEEPFPNTLAGRALSAHFELLLRKKGAKSAESKAMQLESIRALREHSTEVSRILEEKLRRHEELDLDYLHASVHTLASLESEDALPALRDSTAMWPAGDRTNRTGSGDVRFAYATFRHMAVQGIATLAATGKSDAAVSELKNLLHGDDKYAQFQARKYLNQIAEQKK
jgi:hypothetical protein